MPQRTAVQIKHLKPRPIGARGLLQQLPHPRSLQLAPRRQQRRHVQRRRAFRVVGVSRRCERALLHKAEQRPRQIRQVDRFSVRRYAVRTQPTAQLGQLRRRGVALGLSLRGQILNLDQILGQHKGWLEHEPAPLLRIAARGSVHRGEPVVIGALDGRAIGLVIALAVSSASSASKGTALLLRAAREEHFCDQQLCVQVGRVAGGRLACEKSRALVQRQCVDLPREAWQIAQSDRVGEWHSAVATRSPVALHVTEAVLHGARELARHLGWLRIEEVLERALVRAISRAHELLEPLLELVAQMAIVDTRHARHTQPSDAELRVVGCHEARGDEVDTRHVPHVGRFAVLEADVASCLKLHHEPADGRLARLAHESLECGQARLDLLDLPRLRLNPGHEHVELPPECPDSRGLAAAAASAAAGCHGDTAIVEHALDVLSLAQEHSQVQGDL